MLEAPSRPPKRKGGGKEGETAGKEVLVFVEARSWREGEEPGGGQGQIEREQASEDVHRRYNIMLTYTW